jgi:hypothetical protein
MVNIFGTFAYKNLYLGILSDNSRFFQKEIGDLSAHGLTRLEEDFDVLALKLKFILNYY